MSISFGNFDHTSPLSSSPHDPMLSLASNCIRDYFGPTVQMVADSLQFRGEPSTFNEIVATLRDKCPHKHYSQERIRLLGNALASRLRNQSLQLPPLRAALLVLIQHSIVVATMAKVKGKLVYRYEFDCQRARFLPRYPRYVDYARRALDATAAALVEELLVQGRLRTVDVVQKTLNRFKLKEAEYAAAVASAEGGGDNNNSKPEPPQVSIILESFKRLKLSGYLKEVPPLVDQNKREEEEMIEAEFEGAEPPVKKIKLDPDHENHKAQEDEDNDQGGDFKEIMALLKTKAFKEALPQRAVWHVNVHMFHDSLRAFILGRLVAEKYGPKVQSSGSMITAALKYVAHCRHAEDTKDVEMTVDAQSIMRYLPKPIIQLLEKKRQAAASSSSSNKNSDMSTVAQVARSLRQLASYQQPPCIVEVEVGAKPEDSKFEVATTRMVQYLQQRIIHQMVHDHHGLVAARIVTILTLNGHLESDSLAEAAMVPAKDTREILHQLYRAKYIDLFTLSTSRQHNPSNMIYLWTVKSHQILQNSIDNVCTALLNLRLRRQHQVEVGRNWIERAEEAGDTDENDHEADRLNHQKFVLGLERLYHSCLQLDETLMVLEDF